MYFAFNFALSIITLSLHRIYTFHHPLSCPPLMFTPWHWIALLCSPHGHSHGTDTAQAPPGCTAGSPDPGPMSTQTQLLMTGLRALWCQLVRGQGAHMRVVTRSQIPGRCVQDVAAGKDRTLWRGNIPAGIEGTWWKRIREIYTPGDSIKRGAKIAACCQVVGDYDEWVRILVFLSSSQAHLTSNHLFVSDCLHSG